MKLREPVAVASYRASDGSIHETRDEALAREAYIALRDLLDDGVSRRHGGNTDAIVEALVDDPMVFARLLLIAGGYASCAKMIGAEI